MSDTKHATKPFDIEGMPPGIPYIVGNEAAERFSFYGMKAILTVFMTQYLLGADGEVDAMSEPQAKFWVHTFVVAAYFFPLIGAIVSDWLFGKYKTILWLSIVYCLGHFCLAVDETRWGLGFGLAFISIGTGAIKPCVSAHVGDQFGSRNKHLLPKIFGWFYVAINLGAFASTLLTPILLDRFGPSVAFGVPGILMAIATVIFWMGRNTFVHVPPRGPKLFEDCFSGEGLAAILRLLPIYVFVAMFWCLFDQTASAWVLQAKNMDLEVNLFGWVIDVLPSQIQAVNPFFILLFVPIFAYVIYPALDKSFGLTPLRKIAIGMFLAVAAFSVSGWIETQIDAGLTPSIGWQVFAYGILTAAEVMVSITCLEFSYTQSPNSMKSVIMSLYLMSVAAGNEFTAIVNLVIQKADGSSRLPGASYYWFFTGCMFVAAVGFLFVVKTYKGKTYIQDEEAPTAHEVEIEADAEGTEH
ncbi:MAG: POT family MFS transporter [Planctomycetaceae bacterium]|nr:POT family MFS transporter [Planctomycetaceae bacterium]